MYKIMFIDDDPLIVRRLHQIMDWTSLGFEKLEAALDYQEKFLMSVRKKLSNGKFVSNAPEQVVAVERKKEADSLSKIESLKAAIAALKK